MNDVLPAVIVQDMGCPLNPRAETFNLLHSYGKWFIYRWITYNMIQKKWCSIAILKYRRVMYKLYSSPVNFRGTTRALSADCGWSRGPTIGFGLLWWRYVKVPDKTDDHMCILLWTFVCGYIYIYIYIPSHSSASSETGQRAPTQKLPRHPGFRKQPLFSPIPTFIYLYIYILFIYLFMHLFIYSWLLLLATLQIIAHTYPQILSPGDDSAQTRQGATWLSRASPYPSWRHLWRGWFLHFWRLASKCYDSCHDVSENGGTQRW